jgi:hypothetical protein
MEVRLYVPWGNDHTLRVDDLGVRAGGPLTLTDVGYAARGDGNIAFIEFAGVDVGYRAATHEEVSGTITPRRLDEPRMFLFVRQHGGQTAW